MYSASVSIIRWVRESMAGSNCPPADFGFGISLIGLLLPPLDVAPAQKATPPLSCSSASATFPLPTGFLRYCCRIKTASTCKSSFLGLPYLLC
ncbi:hypothetical protein [Kamptonema sp. UHCC 0994]|uniref:hypothetical protein n=1 Tax=Kamptonema sp. UHCC 0994 TaxID=3031329 RepID=UPI0023B8EC99|nr:hypothetical protein [Kamptonema sp. UHCC 0994]MDF0555250.1 hypothetical protein [Kamptonema sp. UHCC 0994]